MVQICPACNAECRDIAKFCDQCAAPLAADAVPLASPSSGEPAHPVIAPRPKPQFNWTGLLFIIAIALAIVWITMQPATRDKPQIGMGGAGGGDPMGTMKEVQAQIEGLKGRLKKNPVDIEAIAEMYQLYGQIGQAEKVQPFTTDACMGIVSHFKSTKLTRDEATDKLKQLSLAAFQARDDEGGLAALGAYQQVDPENLAVLLALANIRFDLGRHAESIGWYDKYFAKASSEKQGEEYWNAKVDRASMYIELGKQGDKPKFDLAVAELNEVITANPKHWSAWHNLAMAYQHKGDKAQAKSTFKAALDVADTEYRHWQSEAALAEMEGRQPPPEPDPHAGLDMGGMMDPHSTL